MSWLARLEKKLSRHAVPGLVTYLVAIQAAVYLIHALELDQRIAGQDILEMIWLMPDRVRAGEVWRIVTFLFQPPFTHPIWLIFHWYLLHFFGNVLEQHWGAFRLNLYLIVGWLSTVLVALLVPNLPQWSVSNAYLYTSLFLAFAHLYPDFEMRIYFLIPVKAKWLALLTWLGYVLGVYYGGWPAFWIAAASVADFFLFLGGSVWRQARHAWRGHQFKQRVRAGQAAHAALYHECRVCGITSQMAPRMQFRYCSKCEGQCCYCPEHIGSHDHEACESDEQADAVSA